LYWAIAAPFFMPDEKQGLNNSPIKIPLLKRAVGCIFICEDRSHCYFVAKPVRSPKKESYFCKKMFFL
jgi:hypothetical protein